MKKLKVLIIHNTYQHHGGEDSVVEREIALLRSREHEVETYFRSNNEINNMSTVSVAMQAIWSSNSADEISSLIRRFHPDVIHVHNTFPLISSSIYWAAARNNVPVVQTLHNFRLMCLNALFLREGIVCEDCAGHIPWRGVVRKCYRGSGAMSAILAGMLVVHRFLGTYRNKVAQYIALNNFCRNKFIDGGLPSEIISVKPNYVDALEPLNMSRHGILYVGRLSVEKGIDTLVAAASTLPDSQLRVVGEGPLEILFDDVNGVTKLGFLSAEAVWHHMNSAIALVIPSICYENFPLTLVEAYAAGLPVIASRTGSLVELVTDGETGLLFEPGNSKELARIISWALAHPEKMAMMGTKARSKYEAEFTTSRNYNQLINIYMGVLKQDESPPKH